MKICWDTINKIKYTKHNLQAHHILPHRKFPKLVYNVSNGITLCESCHKHTFHREMDYAHAFMRMNVEIESREKNKCLDQ